MKFNTYKPIAWIERFLTASRGLDSWGKRASCIDGWKLMRSPPNLLRRSPRMSRASSWTDTSSCCNYIEYRWQRPRTKISERLTLAMALLSRPVIRLHMLAAKPVDNGGNSLITVFKPMLQISRSCSFSDSMLLHSVSTIVSTWYSFTLLTNGPRLHKTKVNNCFSYVITKN